MSFPENKTPPQGDNRANDDASHNHWSIRIATVSGIPIRLHLTFLILLAYFAITGYFSVSGGRGVLIQLALITSIFTCVALHELGHSLVAQRYGYIVRDIVLSPIGGVASIEDTPRPIHELWIAVAGPAVNVVIASILALIATVATPDSAVVRIQNLIAQIQSGHIESGFLTLLLWANIMLVVFNCIPAFPMDGGRVLRAALALNIGQSKATRVAATVGQGVAILMGIAGMGWLGLPANFTLIIIAAFVFFGARQERQVEESRAVMDNAPMADAMMRDFITLSHGDTLKHAADVLLAGSQQDFPVVSGDEVVGLLSRSSLLRGLAREGDSAYVASFMDRDVIFASPNDPLEDYLLASDALRRSPVLVRDNPDSPLIGMVTLENAMEFLTLRQISRLREGETNAPPAN